jgi:tetratricopeptide (TPR) repeat protein
MSRLRALRLGGLLAFLLGGLVACDEMTSQDHLMQAEVHLEGGDVRAAVIELKNALQKDRLNAEARLLLGETYLKSSNLESAEKELRLALDYGGDEARAVEALGEVWLRQGKAFTILEELRDEERLEVDRRSRILRLRAMAHFSLGDFVAAEAELSRLLAIAPDDVMALIVRSSVALAQEDLIRSERVLASATTLAPDHPGVLALMGDLKLRQGDTVKARRLFEQLLQLYPNSVSARLALAQAQLVEGDAAAAAKNIIMVLERSPSHTGANFLRAVLALKSGDYAAAKLHGERILEVRPDDPVGLLIVGAASYGLDQLEQAYRSLRAFLGARPDHVVAQRLLASTSARLELRYAHAGGLTPLLDGTADDAAVLAVYDAQAEWRRVLTVAGDAWAKIEGFHEAPTVALDCQEPEAWLAGLPEAPVALPWIAVGLDLACLRSLRDGLAERVKADGGSPVHRALLAQLFLAEGSLEAARKQIDALLADEPNRSAYLILTALVQLVDQHPDLAKSTLKSLGDDESLGQAVEADRLYLLALAYLRAGEPKAAAERFRAALEVDPRHPYAALELARLAALERDFPRASGLVSELLATHPDLAEAHELAGALALVEGEAARAVRELAIALDLAPNATRALKLATAEARAGREDAAVRTLRNWLVDHPRDADLRLALANRLLTMGWDGEAASEFRKVLVVDPLNVVALNNAAWLAHRSGDHGRALDLAERAYGLMPDNPGVLDSLGVILMEGGALERARDLLQHAAGRAPNDLQIQAHYGRSLALLGREDEAEDLLAHILTTDPEFANTESVRLLRDELDD